VDREQIEMQKALAVEALRLLPPSIQESLLEDAAFVDRHQVHTDATISFGKDGPSFKRNSLFNAVRAALGGATDAVIAAVDGATWHVGVKDQDRLRVVVFTQNERKILSAGLLILSPDTQERLSGFNRDVIAVGVDDPAIEEWRRKIGNAAISDEDVDNIHSELRYSPLRIASAISEELESGQCSIALLVPKEERYYERLVGAWNGEDSLSQFLSTAGAAHIRKLLVWNPVPGLGLALLMSSHCSVSEVIAGEALPYDVLSSVFEEITLAGDRFSQVGAIEVGISLLPVYPEIEGHIASLVKQIMEDDPSVEGRLTLLSSLVVFVDGEIARARTLADRPPYWRRLAVISQASLIERELVTAGVPPDSPFSEWAQHGRGQYFSLQSLADLRLEPKWLPDLISPSQLKSEFLGRIYGAAQKQEASIRSDKLRTLLLGKAEGSIHPLLHFPFPFLPGPLEGGSEASSDMPDEIRDNIHEQVAAEPLEPHSFVTLVNSALVFKIGRDHADLAASALRKAKYQFHGGGSSELYFSLLSGLATVAAVTRSGELANDVWILTQAVRRRFNIDAVNVMRIGLIAAAAFPDKNEWAKAVGEWMTGLAFEDLSGEAAANLLSHIRVLCHIEPDLWRTCAPAEAALTLIVPERQRQAPTGSR